MSKQKKKAFMPNLVLQTPLIHRKHEAQFGKLVTKWILDAGFEGELVVRSIGNLVSGVCYVYKDENERMRGEYLKDVLRHLIHDFCRSFSFDGLEFAYTSYSVGTKNEKNIK